MLFIVTASAGWLDHHRLALIGGALGALIAGATCWWNITRVHRPLARVQETLLAIHLKRHTWQRGAPLKPWVFAIARHKIVDSWRRRGRRIELDITEFAEILPEPVNETASNAEVGRALEGLPEGQRNVVRAIAVEGQSITEASAALGMKPVAVRVALHRGLGAIAARFGKTP